MVNMPGGPPANAPEPTARDDDSRVATFSLSALNSEFICLSSSIICSDCGAGVTGDGGEGDRGETGTVFPDMTGPLIHSDVCVSFEDQHCASLSTHDVSFEI